MAATTSPSPEAQAEPRFDGVTRAVHWANAALFLFLLFTGLVLSFGPLSAAVGRREAVKDLHVWSGLLLPVPVLAGAGGRWGRRLRADLQRLNRWTRAELRWRKTGKFHPGQKLNAAFVGGTIPVMLLTGSIMKWYEPFPLSWRTGATFVHDWTATALLVVTVGHVVKALTTPGALRPMLVGDDANSRLGPEMHPGGVERHPDAERRGG